MLACDSDGTVNGDSTDEDVDEDENGHGNGSCGPVDGPPILGEVSLALKKGAPCVRTIFDLH